MSLSKQEQENLINIPQNWFFTFGSDHGYENCYIKIKGTISTSRDIMNSLFGSRWAFQYPSEIKAGVKKWNLQEINPKDIPHLR